MFSENYASSSWCLDELVEILDCRDSLDPSEVRNHIGNFGKALVRYEEKKKCIHFHYHDISIHQVFLLSGMYLIFLPGRDESQLIQTIVEATLSKLHRTSLHVAKYPVGIEERLKKLDTLIDVGKNDVRIIDIYGIGGIGKTTTAKALFNTCVNNSTVPASLQMLEQLQRNMMDKPEEDYLELSKFIVDYASGLPLALEILGSFLNHVDVSTRGRWRGDCVADDLSGRVVDDVAECADVSDDVVVFNVQTACEALELLQKISDGACGHVRGTNSIEGIMLRLPEPRTLYLNAKSLKKRKALRLLMIDNVFLSNAIGYLPNELRFIDLRGYQFPTVPFNPGPKKLVKLEMPNSHIHELGEGFKNFEKLKAVNLSHFEIHDSVGYLTRLVILNIQGCGNLRIFPNNLVSKYFTRLDFQGRSSLENFPNIVEEMKYMEHIDLSGSRIKELPSSIERLVGLRELNLSSCLELMYIPPNIYKLLNVEELILGGCSKLSVFPKNVLFSQSELLHSPKLVASFLQIWGNLQYPLLKSVKLQNL
ncbi:disease resistance protein RPS6-like [Ziziphus jujuba]|uniref:Disease resistance protein RPS6-like n=1 Tax=Ziziphus jujuba TaxID=326968 RepID=A0ABM4A2V8_ZIZJJ|nr:disease resistance protein RPS6-like [Ziziphus jujuba]